MRARLVVLLLLGLAGVPSAQQQASVRRATNIEALAAFPSFYHLRPIVVVGTVTRADNGDLSLADGTGSIRVVAKGRSAPDGLDEVRGDFWDVGHMNPSDPRLAAYDLAQTFHMDPNGAWPRAGQVVAIIASSITQVSAPSAASIREIVLFPTRFIGEHVTITGQFAGRNLLGELPDAPAKTQYDFVLRTSDAAIWVTNVRPRGKDFELSLDTRIDTGRWVEVSGTLRQGRGLQWLEAEPSTLKLSKAPAERPPDEPVRVTLGPPPEVVFSAPTEDETDVLLSTVIRIQFSRDLDPASLKGHVHVKYDDKESVERGEPVTPALDFATRYLAANRELEIHFNEPLERFRHVIIALDDGVLGTDKQPLKAWTLNFNTGGT